jgi:outer membrane receptor protein involved in Fe transport
MHTPQSIANAVLALVIAVMVSWPAIAHAQTVTGALFGRVTDQTGLPLPGVTVTITSPQLITGQEVRVTDEAGQFRFATLAVGTYTVTFTLQGFTTLRRENVQLSAGAAVAVDGQLQVAALGEVVTVSGASAVIDLKNSQQVATVTQQLIQTLPNRSFVDAYHLMPGIVDGAYRDVTPGASSVNGGSSRNNRLNLEGANVNDAAYGYPSTDLSYEIIQEVQVTTAGISAEFGGASGGVFNVITKSGGNKVSGQTSLYYTGNTLQGSNVTDAMKALGTERGTTTKKSLQGGASLGGPVLRNRLWYFGDYQRKNDDSTMIGIAPTVTERANLYFAKMTGQVSNSNRLEGFFSGRSKYYYPWIPDVDLKDDAAQRDGDQYNTIFNGKWTETLGSSTFIEINGNRSNQWWYANWPNAAPDQIGYIDRATGATFGGIYRGHGSPVHRNTRQVKADISHFAQHLIRGSHDFKAGVSYDLAYSAENRVWGTTGMVQYVFNSVPDRIGFSNYPVNPVGNTATTAAYAQDQWSLSDRLTLNLGVRFEHVTSWFPATTVGGINMPKVDVPEEKGLVSASSVSPRLGVVYDLTGDKRTVVKATFGYYYDQLGSTDFASVAKWAEGQRIFTWNDLNGDLKFQQNEQGALISDSTIAKPTGIDPDLRTPYWTQFTLGFQREIASGISVGLTGIYKKQFDVIQTIDAARPFDLAYQPVTLSNPLDRQPITVYAMRPAYQTLPTQLFITNPSASDCSFCVDPELQYKAIEFTFNKRTGDRWGLQGSYVYSHAEGNLGTHHRTVTSSIYSNPNNLVNAWGSTTLDRPHQFKLLLNYEAPYGFDVSGIYEAQSGVPLQQAAGVLGPQVAFTAAASPQLAFERIVVVKGEAPGTHRMSFQHLLSTRIERRFPLGGSRSLGILLDLSNILNVSAVNYLKSVRVDLPDYQKPGDLVQPRTARLGIRLRF